MSYKNYFLFITPRNNTPLYGTRPPVKKAQLFTGRVRDASSMMKTLAHSSSSYILLSLTLVRAWVPTHHIFKYTWCDQNRNVKWAGIGDGVIQPVIFMVLLETVIHNR